MDEQIHWRRRVKSELERYFKRRSLPRFVLGLVLTVTGVVGFLLSFLLLRAGVHAMWLRYPAAALGAYSCFLALLRLWIEVERQRFNIEEEELQKLADHSEPLAERTDRRNWDSGGSKDSWLDWAPTDFGVDEGCLPMILIAVAAGLIGFFVLALINAPALLSEVFLDAFLVSALYRRLRIASKEHWLESALRQTWPLALATAILLCIGGACLQLMAPGARSIGPALHRIFNPDASHQVLEDEL